MAIGVGSNLGDRLGHLRGAVEGVSEEWEVVGVSSVYESAPVGYRDQGDFLNAVVLVRTAADPGEVLRSLQALEAAAGRVREISGGPRTLDLDLILWEGGAVDEPDLTIPHPHWKERAFVLVPLSEVAPEMRDPVSGKAVRLIRREQEGALEPVTRILGPGWAARAALRGEERE